MLPATAAAITAIAALAQAGGAAWSGKAQGDALDEQAALAKKRLLIEQQNREQDLRIAGRHYGDEMAARRRTEVSQAPANSISMLAGLNGLRNANSQANGLDVLGMLAGR